MLAFHMFCDEDGARACAVAGPLLDAYLHSLVEATWIGSPDQIIAAIERSR